MIYPGGFPKEQSDRYIKIMIDLSINIRLMFDRCSSIGGSIDFRYIVYERIVFNVKGAVCILRGMGGTLL